jgi:hypothetical protein
MKAVWGMTSMALSKIGGGPAIAVNPAAHKHAAVLGRVKDTRASAVRKIAHP